MISYFHKKNSEELLKTPIVQQTAFWSEVKKNLGIDSHAFDFKVQGRETHPGMKADVHTDVLVLLRQAGQNSTVAYVPYGPEYEPVEEDQGVFLEELSECIRGYLPKNCISIRYDLSWESLWAKDDDYYNDGIWIGPPEKDIQELRFNFNTVKWNLRKSSSNNLPSSTVFLDLSQDLPTIRMSMKPKTRYNMELAVRRGVHVVESDDLKIWYELYKETALRNKLYLHNIEFFRTVLGIHSENTSSPAEVILLVAMHDGFPLAAMFLVISGTRATYLYGASSSHNRHLMGPYALQWQAITIAKEKKCTEYDMFGVSPKPDPSHPLYGIYRFKIGFGGKIFHTSGCWDYPLDNEVYKYFSISEMTSQGYHIN